MNTTASCIYNCAKGRASTIQVLDKRQHQNCSRRIGKKTVAGDWLLTAWLLCSHKRQHSLSHIVAYNSRHLEFLVRADVTSRRVVGVAYSPTRSAWLVFSKDIIPNCLGKYYVRWVIPCSQQATPSFQGLRLDQRTDSEKMCFGLKSATSIYTERSIPHYP